MSFQQILNKSFLSRFLRHVLMVYVDFPGELSLKQIYGTFNCAMLQLVPFYHTPPLAPSSLRFLTLTMALLNSELRPQLLNELCITSLPSPHFTAQLKYIIDKFSTRVDWHLTLETEIICRDEKLRELAPQLCVSRPLSDEVERRHFRRLRRLRVAWKSY